MRILRALFFLLFLHLSLAPVAAQEELKGPRFTLTYPAALHGTPFTGRVFVFLSRGGEPRFGPNWFNPQPFFALDVKDWKPGEPLILGTSALAYPKKLDQIAPSEYSIQAVIDLDLGGRRIGDGPGNLYSKTIKAALDPKQDFNVAIPIDQVAKERPFNETQRIKLVDVQSRLLTRFHGKPIHLRAGVLLPPSFETSPQKKYPIIFEIPGFGGDHRGIFRTPSGNTEPGGVEMIYVVLDPDCRTGHHVFADSDNNGPYGQALIQELVPEIEKRFRGIGRPTARFLTGHSSGGWSSLWLQGTYPDFFGGTWSTAPDPVDFRDFQRINLYAPGANMFVDENGAARPLARMGGRPVLFYKGFSEMEDVMGRGGQLYSFEAVFSPKDGNGKPRMLWDRKTGAVDPEVAKYWERYDIRLQLERNWEKLGPKLQGKIHVYMGDQDTFYLEGASKLLKESLEKLKSDAVVELHPGKDHGSLLTRELRQKIAAGMAEAFKKHHPTP